MRIAVVQINTVLGDFQSNSDKIKEYILKARDRHCDLVVFPESTIFGYHPFDMLERTEWVDAQLKELENIRKEVPQGMAVVVGVISKNKNKKGRPYFNSAVVLQKSKKPIVFNKQLLPTGDVFDEARFIENGDMQNNVFTFKKKKIFVTICEDIWAWPDVHGPQPVFRKPTRESKGEGN